jgi:integrase
VIDRYHELMAARKAEPDGQVQADLVLAVIEQFLEWVERRKAPRTYEWYRRHLEAFAKAIPRTLPVAKLKPNHVTQIIDAHDEWSPSTKHGFARCVQRAFRWAADEGIIGRSPLIGLTKPEPEERDIVISAEEYAAILDVVKEPNLRDLIVTAWETGARPRELCIVEAKHVQLDQRRWVFPKKQAKGKKKPRAVYLTDTALEISRRLVEANPKGALYRNSDGEPWNRWSINCAFVRIRTALGRRAMKEKGISVDPLPRFKKSKVGADRLSEARAAHQEALKDRRKQIAKLALENAPPYNLGAFRHSFGDRLLKAGVDPITVANLLGHKNLAMLANTYSHLNQDPEYLREQARRATRGGDA